MRVKQRFCPRVVPLFYHHRLQQLSSARAIIGPSSSAAETRVELAVRGDGMVFLFYFILTRSVCSELAAHRGTSAKF